MRKRLAKKLAKRCRTLEHQLFNLIDIAWRKNGAEHQYWIHGLEECYSYCRECAGKQLAKLLANDQIEEPEEAFVDGGWYPMESDGLEYCTGCGKPLSCSPHECVQILCEYGKVRDWYDLFAVICATNSEGLENLPNCRVLKLPPMMRHIARRVEKSWKKRQRSACRSCAFYRVQGGRFSCVRFRSWGDSTSPEKSACCNFRRRKCYAD